MSLKDGSNGLFLSIVALVSGEGLWRSAGMPGSPDAGARGYSCNSTYVRMHTYERSILAWG